MAVDEQYLNYILEQLAEFGDFEHKKMFGGVGFFRNRVMFAGIMDNVFRLKTNENTLADFEKYGLEGWAMKGRDVKMPYYQVPDEILNDTVKLAEWAERAYNVALGSRK